MLLLNVQEPSPVEHAVDTCVAFDGESCEIIQHSQIDEAANFVSQRHMDNTARTDKTVGQGLGR